MEMRPNIRECPSVMFSTIGARIMSGSFFCFFATLFQNEMSLEFPTRSRTPQQQLESASRFGMVATFSPTIAIVAIPASRRIPSAMTRPASTAAGASATIL
jgi:hypothetical protein